MTTDTGDRVSIYHGQMVDYGIRPDEIFKAVKIRYPLMLLENTDHTLYIDVRSVQIQKISALPTEDKNEAQS